MPVWGPHVQMPLRGDRTCPFFDPENVATVLRFFQDLEALFSRANLSDDTECKKHAIYYSPGSAEYIWKGLASFSDVTKTYEDFRDDVTAQYGYKGLEHQWKVEDLRAIMAEYEGQRAPGVGFQSLAEYQAFYRRFNVIITYLSQSCPKRKEPGFSYSPSLATSRERFRCASSRTPSSILMPQLSRRSTLPRSMLFATVPRRL